MNKFGTGEKRSHERNMNGKNAFTKVHTERGMERAVHFLIGKLI